LEWAAPFLLQQHETVLEHVAAFQLRLERLYLAPRIHEPLWLSLVTFPQRRAVVCQRLYGPDSFAREMTMTMRGGSSSCVTFDVARCGRTG